MAKKLLIERQIPGFKEKLNPRWPYLWALVEKNELFLMDYLLAEKIYPEASQSEAALIAILSALSRRGHLCVKINDPPLHLLSSKLTTVQKLNHFLKEAVFLLDKDKKELPICIEADMIYLQKNWIYETRLIHHLTRLLKTSPKEIALSSLDANALNNEQKKALENAFKYSLSIITGGPGTGKTYTAAQIAAAFLEDPDMEIVATAPTGKAAFRLETSFRKVKGKDRIRFGTLHSILNLKQNIYPIDINPLMADLVIVDECSMIDASLFSHFLSAVKNGVRLILMGDKSQLPPIGEGSVFADLIHAKESGKDIPCTYLKQFLRSDQKEILELATGIQKGDFQELKNHFFGEAVQWKDFGLRKKNINLLDSYDKIWEQVKSKFPLPSKEKPDLEKIVKDLNHFVILTTLRKGPFGVNALNQMIKERICQLGEQGDYCAIPIMITQNDAKLNLCNGEVGILLHQLQGKSKEELIWHQEEAVFLGKEENQFKKFHFASLPEFEYGYCLSVHKSQGSEYDHVLLLMPRGTEAFGKELLYTAITRAKKSLVFDTEFELLEQTLEKVSTRISGLSQRL